MKKGFLIRMIRITAPAVLWTLVLLFPLQADARLFHAAARSAAKRIMAKGINPAKFKAGGRFGKGFYASRTKATAIAEKGKRSTLIRMREIPRSRMRILDLRRPTSRMLKRLLGRKTDLRGAVKKNIIGPKAGQRIGGIAGGRGKAIEYRSVKTGGTNLFIPKKVFMAHPKVGRPAKTVKP